MNIISTIRKKINSIYPLIFIPYFSLFFFVIFFLVLHIKFQKEELDTLLFIIKNSPRKIFFNGSLYFIVIFLITILIEVAIKYIFLIKDQKDGEHFLTFFSTIYQKFKKNIKPFFHLYFLIFINFLFLTPLIFIIDKLGNYRIKNYDFLINDFAMYIDRFFTGTYAFIFLGNLHYSSWFLKLCSFSYLQIGTALVFSSIVFFLFNRKIFEEFVATFLLTLIPLTISWVIFPVLTPLDRYIDNRYELPIEPYIKKQLSSYSPQEEIKEIFNKWLERKPINEVTNVTGLPSAHIVWIVLLGIYLFRYNRKIFFIFSPLLFLSALGTILFAMHYIIDVIGGIIVAIIGVKIIDSLSKKAYSSRLFP